MRKYLTWNGIFSLRKKEHFIFLEVRLCLTEKKYYLLTTRKIYLLVIWLQLNMIISYENEST